MADQASGIDAVDGGTNDCVEILAEPCVELCCAGLCQVKCVS
jgi:hypothetical protein